jgi:N-acetylglucosamine kinase-like BadF-type ATPase
MSGYVLGIDGGGTKTHAVIMDSAGRLRGSGYGGASNYDHAGIAGARHAIATAVAQARLAAGIDDAPPAAAFLGMAGVVSDDDRATIRAIATDLALAPAERTGIDHDCRIALAGGLSGRPGIVQIAGTGSACFGMNAAGEAWRAGGWGHLLADEGSSYWLGLAALQALVRAHDGRAAPGELTTQVRAHLGLADMNDIMRRVYVGDMGPGAIAALAPLVVAAAQRGEPLAVHLLERAADELVDCIAAVARRLGLDRGPCELALVGGLFAAGTALTAPLARRLAGVLPECRMLAAELPPAVGACLLALQSLGHELAPAAILALRDALSVARHDGSRRA